MFDVEGMAEKGKSFMTEYKHQLHLIEKRDSVPMELTTSVLGIESGFGRTAGKYCIVNSLATLFFEGRKNFAARELTSLFELCRLSNMDPFDVKGSFAGAIGFMQFIPSSLLPYIARGEITFKSALTMEGAIDLCADYLKKSGAQFGDTAANHKALLAYNNSENYAALIETVSGRISSEATVIREKIGSRPEIPAF
jgi:membrane-bound lytic murein transglycosylase B